MISNHIILLDVKNKVITDHSRRSKKMKFGVVVKSFTTLFFFLKMRLYRTSTQEHPKKTVSVQKFHTIYLIIINRIYVKCIPLALNAESKQRKSLISIFAALVSRYPSVVNTSSTIHFIDGSVSGIAILFNDI